MQDIRILWLVKALIKKNVQKTDFIIFFYFSGNNKKYILAKIAQNVNISTQTRLTQKTKSL